MKRFKGPSTAPAFVLAFLSAAGGAGAATDPVPAPAEVASTPPSPSMPAGADEAAPPSPPAPAPPVTSSAPPPPAPALVRNPTEASRDSYDGPPLLLGGSGKKVKVGAYGALGGSYTRFMGRDSGLVSLEGALLVDHRFSIGLAGYGFTRTPRGPDALDGSRQEIGAGYGGIAIRYSWLTSLPVYPTFGVVLGAGAVNLHRDRDRYRDWDDDWDHDDDWERGSFDPFLVVQPEVALHANVTRWLRLGANLGYRFTGGVGRFGLEERDLNGVVAGGSVAFGWF